MACDERVIRSFDDSAKAAYSQALPDCSFPRRSISACPLCFGEVGVKERVKSVLNYRKPTFWAVIAALAVCAAAAACFMTDPKDSDPDLTFLNYENSISTASDLEEIHAIYYPPTKQSEDGLISIGYASGNDLARYLDLVSRQEWKAPGEGLASPGSIEFCIQDDYRITIYQKPRRAVVNFQGKVRYCKTHGGDYEDAVDLFYKESRS